MAFDLKGRTAAIALATMLAAGMCPALASATELTAGADAAKVAQLETQASKKTVYVLTSITEAKKGRSRTQDDKIINSSSKATVKLTYNSKGLLAKSNYTRTYNASNGGAGDTRKVKNTWAYDKKNRLVRIKKGNGTFKLARDSAGRVKKATASWGTKISFSYKSGRVAQTKTTMSSDPNYTGIKKLSYKNGKPATIKSTSYGYTNTYKPVYDKHGNMTTAGLLKSLTFAMGYNSKGQLVKRSRSAFNEKTGLGSATTITYKYKAIKVSKNLAPTIKAQQWALLNDNFNYAIDPMLGEGYFSCTNNFGV